MDVTSYNTSIQVFPTNILANIFHFTPEELFELEQGAEANTKINF